MLKRFLANFKKKLFERKSNFLLKSVLIAIFSLGLMLLLVKAEKKLVRSPLTAISNEINSMAFFIKAERSLQHQVPLEDIVILDIDDASINALGRVNLWPRAYEAKVVDFLSSAEANMIALDLIFSESDKLPNVYTEMLSKRGISNPNYILNSLSTDSLLANSIKKAGNVYLSIFDNQMEDNTISDSLNIFLKKFTISQKLGYNNIINPVFPIYDFSKAAKGMGLISMSTDDDGVVRYYQLINQFRYQNSSYLIPNIPFIMFLDLINADNQNISFSDNQIEVPGFKPIEISSGGEIFINWLPKGERFRKISFYKVLQEKVPVEFFKDKYIFIGTSASGLGDLKITPMGELLPGVEIHALMFYNLANNRHLKVVEIKDLIIPFFLLSVFLTFLILYYRPIVSVFIFIGWFLLSTIIYLFVVFSIYEVVIPYDSYIVLILFTFITSLVFKYITEERDILKIKKAFSSYISPGLAELIVKDPGLVHLSGERRKLTVLFSDIRGFTTLTEIYPPQVVVSFLNYYLSFMTEIIFKHEGTIDKFMGDGIMVIYGAPVSLSDNAKRACETALEMKRRLGDVNKFLADQNIKPIKIGIGINSGEMTVGNIGSDRKFDYTVIGDNVNIGARLEKLNKLFGTTILISENTFNMTKDFFPTRKIGLFKVRGKNQGIIIYELLDETDVFYLNPQARDEFEKGVERYINNSLDEAYNVFQSVVQEIPDDEPSKYYLNLIKQIKNNEINYSPILSLIFKE